MFFIKKSEIVLDCFTDLPFVYDYAKVNHAIKFLPEWWKETPKIESNIATIKNCQGIIDFYKKGFIIPSWFSLNLTVKALDECGNGEQWTWTSSNKEVQLDYHQSNQFFRFSEDDSSNLKFESPWFFRTKDEALFTMTQPTWNHRNWLSNFITLPGILNFKTQHATNINFLVINGQTEKHILIEPLTPLVILHPLTDKKVVIKTHLVDKKELERITGIEKFLPSVSPQESIDKRLNRKKFINKFNTINQCPFK